MTYIRRKIEGVQNGKNQKSSRTFLNKRIISNFKSGKIGTQGALVVTKMNMYNFWPNVCLGHGWMDGCVLLYTDFFGNHH